MKMLQFCNMCNGPLSSNDNLFFLNSKIMDTPGLLQMISAKQVINHPVPMKT